MKSTPEISVIIPAFNAGAYLARAVDSVLAQKDCDYELIIVDNNSEDDTWITAKIYEHCHPLQVRLLTETKPGASAARNRGLTAARAPWIQFLDADDMLLPGKLNRQLAIANPGLDWIIGTLRMRDQDGRETEAAIASDPWQGLLTYTGLGHLDANLFRTETLRKLGGFNEEYLNCNDFELFFRLVKSGVRTAKDLVPGAILIHHAGPRITSTDRPGMARRRVELTGQMIDYLQAKQPEYFKQHRTMINAALLRVFRKQATVDLPAAIENFKRCFPEGFKKADFDSAQLPAFYPAYSLFGFGKVERVRVFLAGVLPSPLKSRLKGVS